MHIAFANTIFSLAENDENVVWISADNGTDYDKIFSNNFPKQYINAGIAEENMVAMSAGMASEGKIPFIYTGSTFLAYRAYEFIRNDICLQNRNVKLIGFGAGFSISNLGVTHHATEDISLLRTLPNMVILSPATAEEVREAVVWAYEYEGPVYIRLEMSAEQKAWNDENAKLSFGKNKMLKNGTELALFAVGSMVHSAMRVAERLEEENISCKVVNSVFLAPFDYELLETVCKECAYLVSIEEHSCIGGLGSILSDYLIEHNKRVKLCKIGLSDGFAYGYGTHTQMRELNKLDDEMIYKRIKEFIQK